MAFRTTQVLVQGIVDVDLVSWPDLTPFIQVANEIVTEVCSNIQYGVDANGNPDPSQATGIAAYSSTRLELIERWLSAHFYAIADPRLYTEQIGPFLGKSEVKVGLNFQVTTYGQQAMNLDTAGGLAVLQRTMTTGVPKIRVGVVRYLGDNPNFNKPLPANLNTPTQWLREYE